jgi:hypothetical protein
VVQVIVAVVVVTLAETFENVGAVASTVMPSEFPEYEPTSEPVTLTARTLA